MSEEEGNEQGSITQEGARRKSRQALDSARVLLDTGDAEGAVNRTYYALFYLAAAALEAVEEEPKTHSGTLNRFWERFVKSEHFPRETAEIMHTAFGARQKADYNFISVHDTAAALDLLADVEAFCEKAEALLDELSGEHDA